MGASRGTKLAGVRELAGQVRRYRVAAMAAVAGATLAVSGCTGGGAGSVSAPRVDVAQAAFHLVSYDSCADLLGELRKAAAGYLTAWGFGGEPVPAAAEAAEALTAGRDSAHAGMPAAGPVHSGTNTHEAGVDEPDLVKTDGRRIVTLMDGTLRVVDPVSKRVTGTLRLADQKGVGWYATQLLLAGDRALAIGTAVFPMRDPAVPPGGGIGDAPETAMPAIYPAHGTRLALVDLSSAPRVLDTIDLDGFYVDARQVGSMARLVVRSTPHLRFVHPDHARSEDEALRANRQVLAQSSAADWLPRVSRSGGEPEQLVACADVRHPRAYTGMSMLTVLSVDLAGSLRTKDSIAIVADGQTVYGTGSSLYVADDHRGLIAPMMAGADIAVPEVDKPQTEVHKFDGSAPGKPRYVASGVVDGWLLNQYSLSEFDGYLRIATTEQRPVLDNQGAVETPEPVRPRTESAVTVLAQRGDRLVPVSRAGGLGKGEQIYSVRFIGAVGYVVTFRQTDPLYTLDLSDPARPRVVGELKITGFSSYLHPIGDGRLLGVGQDATTSGRVQGAQVSLFDVSDPSASSRLDAYALPGGWSEAENDPHAFLYWPNDRLVVVPVWAPPIDNSSVLAGKTEFGGAVALRLDGDRLAELGFMFHPATVPVTHDPTIRRSLVIGDTLWTVSNSGAMASSVADLARQAWVPFT
jgi:Beta propeller domain